MSWQCECGVTNRDSRTKCSACGTPKGMVWTPQGFRPPDEAAALGDAVSKTLPYAGGAFFVFGAVVAFIGTLVKAPVDPGPSILLALFYALLAAAAAVRQPWGWHVLLGVHTATIVFTILIAAASLLSGGSNSIWIGPLFAGYAFVSALWFIYFYKRRTRFGAKGRWKWFERAFPSFVGPEEETPIPSVQPESDGLAVSQAKATEHVHPTFAKEPDYLNKQCPRCAEQIHLEATQCQYCGLEFDPEELATLIAPIFEEFAQIYDLKSATKQCPDCAESIKLEALICRYCRHNFRSADVQTLKMKALREKIKAVRREMEGKQGR